MTTFLEALYSLVGITEDDMHVTEYTPTHAEMLDAWTAYTKRGQGITGRDAALGEYLRFMHATRQENTQ